MFRINIKNGQRSATEDKRWFVGGWGGSWRGRRGANLIRVIGWVTA